MKKYIRVTGVKESGDYEDYWREISDEAIQLIMPVVNALKNCKIQWENGTGNWPATDQEIVDMYGHQFTPGDLEFFNDDYAGPFTGAPFTHIAEIAIYHVSEVQNLLWKYI